MVIEDSLKEYFRNLSRNHKIKGNTLTRKELINKLKSNPDYTSNGANSWCVESFIPPLHKEQFFVCHRFHSVKNHYKRYVYIRHNSRNEYIFISLKRRVE